MLDLKSAFFQIQLKEKDKEKLAFCCELGNFQPCRLPFGAKNSTSYFHTLMSKCLKDIQGSNIQFFLDNIILASDTIHEMKCLLQQVFERLEKFNLTLDPAKMQICENKITYLGFELDKSGYSPSEENVRKVTKFPVPKNIKEVQSYLDMLNYFRHLIFNFAELAQPIVLYAIFLSVNHFSEHLYGREFSILTDAKPLSHHIHLDKQPDIVARWLLYLRSFSYSIEHVPGFSNPTDFLTRVQEETRVNNLKIFPIPNGMNYDNIKSHQQNDKETKEIIDKINDNNNATCKDYYMDNNSGLLMIKMKPRIKHLRNKHIENKIVTAKSLVKTCLESAHGPHFGTKKKCGKKELLLEELFFGY
ncbi:Retrovirus-related Pol polyprotein from transposon 17.6 [Araneus ventricosus]|uniref:Retrovirus-related Pol polyprotein from transposon 17.6 n=1 Tax=Araneus ventricosus TaxID=182803 RepID=A0A4Y2LGY0_ARAVE|nr:Retrovirus-related Pol polyprotein from transposon 17.6 [Araneus ventricosus]